MYGDHHRGILLPAGVLALFALFYLPLAGTADELGMLTYALLTQAQGSVGRSRYKEGAQGTDDDTDEEGQGEILEGTRPQEQGADKENRTHRQNTAPGSG